jgi:hypothetical protein
MPCARKCETIFWKLFLEAIHGYCRD